MDDRLKRLEETVGALGDGLSQLAAGTAGRQDLDTEFGQAFYKRNESTLVRDTNERASNIEHACTWGRLLND